MHQIYRVVPLQTTESSTNTARWYFDDEIESVTSAGAAALVVDGRTVVDFNFDPNESPAANYIDVIYDDVIEPGMTYVTNGLAENVGIVFEQGDGLGAAQDTVIEEPFVFSLAVSSGTNMDEGPAALYGLRFNTLSALSNVVKMNIYYLDLNGKNIAEVLPAATRIRVEKVGSPAYYGEYAITNVTDPQYVETDPPQPDTGYRQVDVSLLEAHFALAADDAVTVTVYHY